MTPTFNVSNNFPTASGDKRKKTKSLSFITPKKGTKEIDSAANILSINPLVQTPKLVATANSISESTVGVSYTTSAPKKISLV